MQTRKIYLSGGSTYVVSLPKKWVESANLKEGDSVVVTAKEGAVLIEPGYVERQPSKIELQTSRLRSSGALERLIISDYLAGYDAIRIRLDAKNADFRETARKISSYLIGVEVIEDAREAITLEILVDHQRLPTTQALHRIYLLCKSMLSDVIRAMESSDEKLARDIAVREREVDRLYFLVVRQLKSAVRYQHEAERLGIKNQRDSLGYRIVVKSFERIADHLENIALTYAELLNSESRPRLEEFIKLAGMVLAAYEKATLALFKRDGAAAEEAFEELDEIRKRHAAISNQIFRQKTSVPAAIHRKTILDSIGRVASYSSDIAEIAINMSAELP